MKKRVLGLDLGTASIGWALVLKDLDNKFNEIIGAGSRIIPMSNAVISDFESGITKSQTADRTGFRGKRRLYERSNIRRERLHRVLNVLGYLPETYEKYINFNTRKGQFKKNCEPLLPYSDVVDEKGKRIFLFKEPYEEMEEEFRKIHTSLPKLNKKGEPFKLPYDWTLYFLRKKALTKEISNAELAWILLNFNQKRGYYQERVDQEVKIDEKKEVKYEELNVHDFIKTDESVDDKPLYRIIYEKDGVVYDDANTKTTNIDLWKDKIQAFIISTTQKKEGISRTYKIIKEEDDWEAIKRKTEQNLGDEFVGKYIYETLLRKPTQKIRGGLIKTIDRGFYFDELQVILRTQFKYRSDDWTNQDLYKKAIEELYPNNKDHQLNLLKEEDMFIHLFLKDILFYHRPLKSKKSLITKCTFEKRVYIDSQTKEKKVSFINGIPKSNPLFQEFRIWQLVANIKIQRRELILNDKLIINKDVTDSFLKTEQDITSFFDYLFERKEIKQKDLISYFIKDKKEQNNYRWNFTDDDTITLECNQTRSKLVSKFSKTDKQKLTKELEFKLWHIVYSVADKEQYTKAINSFVKDFNLSDGTKKNLGNAPILKKEYASYSEKAIKKLLSLMRTGIYWKKENINPKVLDRIDKLLTGEYDENIVNRVREKAIDLKEVTDFQNLPLWLVSYIVYGKHSEVDITQWQTSKELSNYINSFKQHSLKNPIVEQVLLESLRVTLAIWEFYAEKFNVDYENYFDDKTQKQKKSYHRLFDEIHIEIGRDLKNPKKVRERLHNRNKKNKETNSRIRNLLYEFQKDKEVKDVIAGSKTHFEKLKIFEQTILSNYSEKELKSEKIAKDLTIEKFIKKPQPSSKEILKYRLWLEQKYMSPYTGRVISLSDLFTSKYEIEHVIPQSKHLDDSFNNKVICEADVNRLKDNRTAYVFIQEFQNTEVPLSGGGTVTISNRSNYEEFVRKNYLGKKQQNLLQEEIPQNLTERQKNNMRYVSKEALKIYSNIVREKGEQESTVKNVLPVSGGVTARLRAEWGLNAVWSSLVENRFKRLNKLVCGEEFENNGLFGSYTTHKDKKHNFFKPQVPIELKDNFQIKRIDHRHHALDAIVIACTTRNHINYINNNQKREGFKRFDLGKILRNTKEIEKINVFTGEKTKHTVLANYKKPWDSFTEDCKQTLEKVVVSFKQNLRVINKAQNINWRYKDEEGRFLLNSKGNPKKQLVKQTKGTKNWAIRKPLHEDTFYGVLENGKYKGYLVKRESLTISFTKEKIEAIVDSRVKSILLKHLQQDKYKNQVDEKGKELKPSEVAFSPNGIQDLNNNIISLNDGVFHHPIKKIRCRFTKGKQFAIREVKNRKGEIKRTKYVKTASGTNLYFCIYEKEGKRKYYVPSFEEIIETQKQEIDLPLKSKKNVPQLHPKHLDYQLKFFLQPNDLVYLPKEENEKVDFSNLTKKQLERIYLFKDGSINVKGGVKANFTPMYYSNVILNVNDKDYSLIRETYKLTTKKIKNEIGLGTQEPKSQKSFDGLAIKELCWKLKIDRIGNIIKAVK